MKQSLQLVFFVAAAWAGSFAIAIAVSEWREDEENETASVGRAPGATQTAAAPTVVITAESGAIAEWAGIRFVVDGILTEKDHPGYTMWVTLQNIKGDPGAAAAFLSSKVVDVEGFNCDAYLRPGRGVLNPLQLDEKATASIYWDCGSVATKTMAFGQAVQLNFAPP